MESHERRGRKPIEILNDLKEKNPKFWEYHLEEKAETVAASMTTPIEELVRHDKNDPNELIATRFLCRGGACLLAGPTGVGKSSFMMQMALSFAAGRPCFDMTPPRKLKVLLVQAENDEGDLAEMRDGVMAGLSIVPHAIAGRLRVMTNDSATGEKFGAVLNTALHGQQYDLAIVDPAFAYIGCSASDQGQMTPFLRNVLNPVIHRHNVGLFLVHHTNKPQTGEEKGAWKAGDFAYLGSGSAEFANWARAVMAIRSVGSETIFQLMASKRGRRLGWRGADGAMTTTKHIAYHRGNNIICWREATPEEINEIMPGSGADVNTVVGMVADGIVDKVRIARALAEEHGVKKTKAYELISRAVDMGLVRITSTGKDNRQTLALTPKAKRECPNDKSSF